MKYSHLEEVYEIDSCCWRFDHISGLSLHIICHSVSPGVHQLRGDHVGGDEHDQEQLHVDVGSVLQEEEGDSGDDRGQLLRGQCHGDGLSDQLLCEEVWLETGTAGGDSVASVDILHRYVLQVSITVSSSEKSNPAPQEPEEEDQVQERGETHQDSQVRIDYCRHF